MGRADRVGSRLLELAATVQAAQDAAAALAAELGGDERLLRHVIRFEERLDVAWEHVTDELDMDLPLDLVPTRREVGN